MMKRMICLLLLLLLMCSSAISAVYAADSAEIRAANALNTLGLFQGTGTNPDGTPIFSLDQTPTRQEAITMIVRLLGKESEATATGWSTPFKDVDNWATPYVGYAYNNQLASGISEIAFGGNDSVTAAQYLTFILRALGYNSNTDFAWDSAWVLSDTLGITSGEYSALFSFTRGNVVEISYNALKTPLKGTSTTLLSVLVSSGAVTKDNVEAAGLAGALAPAESYSSRCYYKTDMKTFTDVTGQNCTSTFIMGESKLYDGYVEGGRYLFNYDGESQAINDLQLYLDYLKSSGFEELEYKKQIDPAAKDYYIQAKYTDGHRTLKIQYYNIFKRISIDPPYMKYGSTFINNNISFYSEFSRIPDAGVYFNLDLIEQGQSGGNFLYVYSSAGLPSAAPIVYSAALTDSGFVRSGTDADGHDIYMSGSLNVCSYVTTAGYFVVEVSK